MGDMGLAGAAGAGAVNDTIQNLIKQRLLQAQFEQQQKRDAATLDQQQTENEFRRQQLASQAQDRTDRLAEQTRLHSQQDEDRKINLASNIAEQVPGGTPMPFQSQTAQMLRTGGRDALLKDQGLTPAAPPSSIAAPGQPPPQEMPGTVNNAPSPMGRLVTKLNTSKQADTIADNERQAAALKQAGDNLEWKRSIEQQLADAKAAGGGAHDHFTPVPQYDERGNPVGTMAFNTGSGRAAPMMGADGKPLLTRAAPGAAAAATEGRHKQEALGSLDQLDQAIENAKELIGPGAGRFTSLEQMAGSADPRAQALGTKMLLAKMRVDAGIGGARAAASPQLLARWDNILANKVDPAGMKAAVQAMREIIGAGGAPSASGGGEWTDIGGGIKIRKKS